MSVERDRKSQLFQHKKKAFIIFRRKIVNKDFPFFYIKSYKLKLTNYHHFHLNFFFI